MKRAIEVKTQAEGDALAKSMQDPVMRAAIVVGGVLADLPPAARRTVLAFCTANCEVPQDASPLPAMQAGNGHPMRLRDGAARSTGE